MIEKILLPTDGTEFSEKTVDFAIDVASMCNAVVVVMYAYSTPTLRRGGETMIEDLRTSLEEEAREIVGEIAERVRAAGITTTTLVVQGTPVEAILKAADEELPDLIVIGSGGRSHMSGVLVGSVAERVVRYADAPVLVVK